MKMEPVSSISSSAASSTCHPSPTARLAPLDGLRGIAAFSVMCFHFALAFLPSLFANHNFWVEDTPLGVLLNGALAVSVFFVLSGFVIAQAAAKRRDPIYISIPLRYLRLALPSTASVIFGWCLLTLLPSATLRLGEVMVNPWLEWTYQQPIPSITLALYDGLIRIFLINGSGFNNVLWTMRIELTGSIIIYAIYGLTNGWIRASIILLFGISTLIAHNFFGFFLGIILREFWNYRMQHPGKLRQFMSFVALSAGMLLSAPGLAVPERSGTSRVPELIRFAASHGLLAPLSAALILYASLNSAILAKGLSSRIPQFLGRISFPLYLVHVPLVYTIFAFLYVWTLPSSALQMFFLFAVFLLTSVTLAFAGECWIDRPVLDLISVIRTKLRYATARSLIHE